MRGESCWRWLTASSARMSDGAVPAATIGEPTSLGVLSPQLCRKVVRQIEVPSRIQPSHAVSADRTDERVTRGIGTR